MFNEQFHQAVSQRVAEQSVRQIQAAHIVYYGVCSACAKRRTR